MTKKLTIAFWLAVVLFIIAFIAQNVRADPPLGPTLFVLQGANQVPNTKKLNFTGGCTLTPVGGTEADVSCSGTSGGTVTSITCGVGLTCTPNPIVGAGTIVAIAAPTPTTLHSGTTGAGNIDTTIFTTPTDATLNTNSYLVTGLICRVLQAMVGGGSVVLTVGQSVGTTEFLLAQTLTSGTTAGTVFGLTSAQVGTLMTAASFYNANVNGNTIVTARTALAGTVSTEAVIECTVTGQPI